jgi:hypothetical protein
MPGAVNAWLIATLKSRRKTPGVVANSLVQARRIKSSTVAASIRHGLQRGAPAPRLSGIPHQIHALCDQKE